MSEVMEVHTTVPSTLELSRERAVQRLVAGAGGVLTGLAAVGSAFLIPTPTAGGVPSFLLFTGGLLVAGFGAAGMSRVASHLWRFGQRRSLWMPVATGGFALSSGVAALSLMGVLAAFLGLPWSWSPPVLQGLFLPGLAGAVGFGVLLAVLTASALVRWLRDA